MLKTFLLVILIVVILSMIGLILLQRSEGGALGTGGGGGQFMTARGAGNVLTKGTQILGGAALVLCLLITFLSGREAGSTSVTRAIGNLKVDPSALNKAAPPPLTAPAPVQSSPFQAPPAGLDNPIQSLPAAPAPKQRA